MKRFIISAMVLVMMIVSIGGCFVPWHGDGRGGRHDRDKGHDRGGDHHKDGGRDGRR